MPPGGSAVVGDRHDRRDVVGEPAQRRQRGVQPVPPAQRHGRTRRAGGLLTAEVPMDDRGLDAHRGQPLGELLAIATERCLPPVQPTASVR